MICFEPKSRVQPKRECLRGLGAIEWKAETYSLAPFYWGRALLVTELTSSPGLRLPDSKLLLQLFTEKEAGPVREEEWVRALK